jgi:hypothetical protein
MAEETAVTCDGLDAQIALHIEGDLPAHEAQRVEAHLHTCARCRAFATEIAESQTGLKDLADGGVDAAALRAVRERVHAALAPRPRRAPIAVPIAGLAAALLLLLLRTPPRAVPVATQRPTASPAPSETHTIAPVPRAETPAVHPMPPARQIAARRRRSAAPVAVEPRLVSAPDGLATPGDAGEPSVVVRVPTTDSNVVIYWVVDPNGGPS